MGPLSLFDVVLTSAGAPASAAPAAVDRASRLAEKLVEGAMANLKQIEALDGCMTPAEPSQFDRQTATLLREMYESWARDSDAVLDRVARLRRINRQVAGATTLRDAVGRVRAMLQVTLDDIEEGRGQFETGRVYTREEVRGGLRLGA